MEKQTEILYDTAKEARSQYRAGMITRKTALERIRPYQDMFNETSIRLAKKYGVKPKLFSVASFLR